MLFESTGVLVVLVQICSTYKLASFSSFPPPQSPPEELQEWLNIPENQSPEICGAMSVLSTPDFNASTVGGHDFCRINPPEVRKEVQSLRVGTFGREGRQKQKLASSHLHLRRNAQGPRRERVSVDLSAFRSGDFHSTWTLPGRPGYGALDP